MKQIDIEKVKGETFEEEKEFEETRNNLEQKFHVINLFLNKKKLEIFICF
jgi:hypothetical protein